MANFLSAAGRAYALYRLIGILVVSLILFIIGIVMMASKKKKGSKGNPKVVGVGMMVLSLIMLLIGIMMYNLATSSNNAARVAGVVGTANMARRVFN